VNLFAIAPGFYQLIRSKARKLLRQIRLPDLQDLLKLAHALFTFRQMTQNKQTLLISERLEQTGSLIGTLVHVG
jgi:hypothetical protein